MASHVALSPSACTPAGISRSMNFKKWARHRGDGSPLCISVANLPSGFFQSPYLIGFGLACPQRRCMLLIAKWTFGLGPFADLRRSRGIFIFDGRQGSRLNGFRTRRAFARAIGMKRVPAICVAKSGFLLILCNQLNSLPAETPIWNEWLSAG